MQKAPPSLARFVLLLAAFAACVQWTIPHGWMIASAHDGAGSSGLLFPCPATSPGLVGLAERAEGSRHAHHGHHEMDYAATGKGGTAGEDQNTMHGAAQAQCDFAAVGAPVLPPEAPNLVVPEPEPAKRASAFPEAIPGRGLAAPPPPSRGPPLPRA